MGAKCKRKKSERKRYDDDDGDNRVENERPLLIIDQHV